MMMYYNKGVALEVEEDINVEWLFDDEVFELSCSAEELADLRLYEHVNSLLADTDVLSAVCGTTLQTDSRDVAILSVRAWNCMRRYLGHSASLAECMLIMDITEYKQIRNFGKKSRAEVMRVCDAFLSLSR